MATKIVTKQQFVEVSRARLNAPCRSTERFPGDNFDAVCSKSARHLTDGKTPQDRAHVDVDGTRRWWIEDGETHGMMQPKIFS